MGDVISLAEVRAKRAALAPPAAPPGAVGFFFDLADPGTYLAAERVDRLFPRVAWTPARLDASATATMGVDEAEARAEMLGLPLVWPPFRADGAPSAMRTAAYAAEEGRGAPFVLAASRLAFCGGFDLDDPEVLAEAAAAAGVGLDGALAAARDDARDAPLRDAGRRLRRAGAERLPAMTVGSALFCGERRVGEAAERALPRRRHG